MQEPNFDNNHELILQPSLKKSPKLKNAGLKIEFEDPNPEKQINSQNDSKTESPIINNDISYFSNDLKTNRQKKYDFQKSKNYKSILEVRNDPNCRYYFEIKR